MELQPLSAVVSQQAADLNVYAGFLFATLDGALPPEYLTVERAGSLFGKLRGKEPEVLSVSVRLGEQLFTLRRDAIGKQVNSLIAHEVGGIVLSRQQFPLGVWADQLAAALAQLAQQNDVAAAALQRMTNFTV